MGNRMNLKTSHYKSCSAAGPSAMEPDPVFYRLLQHNMHHKSVDLF
jgi:hypothetical protein